MTSEPGWLAVLPALALAVGLLVGPGLGVGLALRWRPADALGAAPALSLPVLGLGVLLSVATGWSWGLVLALGVTALVVAAVALTTWYAGRRARAAASASASAFESTHEPTDEAPVRDARSASRPALIAAGLAAVASGLLVAVGIGRPWALNQTYDGVFHVNVVRLLGQLHSVDPALFTEVNDPGKRSGFYPPLFHAVAVLLTGSTGVDAVVACNLVAIAMALCWPLSVLLLVRWVAGESRFALALGALAAVTVTLFPVLLLRFGVLWPNTLSLLSLPVMTAVGARALDVLPPGIPVSRRVAGVVFVAVIPGVLLAHPGAFFALLPMLLPAAALAWLRWWRAAKQTGAAGAGRWPLVLGVAVAVVSFGLWLNMNKIPILKATRAQYWPPRNSPAQAVGEVLGLSTDQNPAQFVVGFLAVAGVILLLRRGRLLWLALSYLAIGLLVVLATSFDGPIRAQFTGFWYNDGYRVFAMLPTAAVPLAVLAGLDLRVALSRWLADPRRGEELWARWLRPLTRRAPLVAAVVVLVLVAGWIPGRGGPSAVVHTVRANYNSGGDAVLVSAPEAEMFRRLATVVPAGESIAGNPWEGSVYAGTLSGRTSVWAFFLGGGHDRDLLRWRFRTYQSDPQVCAAVQRLKVAVVTTDTQRLWDSTERFPGFADLDTAPGLTLIDRAGSAKAYRVAPCTMGATS